MKWHLALPQWSGLTALLALGLSPMLPGQEREGMLCREAFRTPPIQARPSALWTWLNGHVDHDQITRELEEMKAKGMRGAIIWDLGAIIDPDDIVPEGPRFLGPESLRSIHHAMDEARRLGLELGMVASSSWNAGGTWITPEDGSKQLLWSELAVEGPAEFSAPLPLPDKVHDNHREVAVLAVPDGADKTLSAGSVPIRLDDRLDAEGRLNWTVPAGKWRVLRFVCSNTGELLNCPSPQSKGLMIDHLSSKATREHIEHVLDTLSRGRTDFEPLKVLMYDSYEVHPAIDWTPEMVALFTKERGYDPVPWLPVLAGWTIASEDLSGRFLHDYRKTVSDLMVRDHFALSRELLRQRGLKLLAEAGHGGYARVDPLKALGAADIPMGEFWNHRKNWVTKEAASAAHIYGKTLVNSESFTGWRHWQDGPAAYKRLLDIALCAGLNQVTFHTFSHNPPEAGLPGFAYHAGEHFNVNSTWWNQAGPMLEDMARACHLLQQGQFVADVCVYYGDEAPNLVPARRLPPTIQPRWDDEHCAHCGRPQPVDLRGLDCGHDHDFINEEVILTRMSVEDGRLVLPDGMSYRKMILPDRKAISPQVLRKLGELVHAGATILGPRPERSNSLSGYPGCDEEVRRLAAQIWGDCDGEQIKSHAYGSGRVFWNTPPNEVLAQLGVKPDFLVSGLDNSERHIDFIHRRTATEDIYFVSNSSLERRAVTCSFRVAPDRVPSFWNAESGEITPCLHYRIADGHTTVPLELEPASSIFVVFSEGEAREHLVELQSTPDSSPHSQPTLELLDLTPAGLKARAWSAGHYPFRTSTGRTGTLQVGALPADQPVDGPWQVDFPKDRGAPSRVVMPSLLDWTEHSDPGVKHFSGSALYRNQFTLTEEQGNPGHGLVLDLGEVREVATVRVNGEQAGILWKKPYRLDIAHLVQPGVNQLEVEVVNTWNNRLVGDKRMESDKPITRTNLSAKFSKQSPLLPSGLLGPVVLKRPMVVSAELER